MKRCLSAPLSLMGVLLLVVVSSACKPETRSKSAQQVSTATTQPMVPVTVNTATPAIAVTSTISKLATCQFSSSISSNSAAPSSINSYTVSRPTVIYSDSNRMNLYGWLPNNEDLIISKRNPNNDKKNYTLNTLNVPTGFVQIYAERTDDGGDRPIWLPDLQAIAYTDFDLPQKPSSLPGIELWLSRGNPNEKHLLAEHVSLNSLTVDDTGQLAYLFSQKNTEAVDLSVKTINAASLSAQVIPLPAALSKPSSSTDESLPEIEKPWEFLHRPTTSQAVLLYKNQLPLLFDFSSGQLCQIEVPLYVSEAQWSPDGRYLAMRTQNAPLNFSAPDTLIILDTSDSQHYQVDLGTHVYGMTWSPNGRHLAVLVQRPNEPKSGMHQNLYLVDALTKEHRQILSEYNFRGGANQNNQMTWSSDGRTLAVTCPVIPLNSSIITEYRLCTLQLSQVR